MEPRLPVGLGPETEGDFVIGICLWSARTGGLRHAFKGLTDKINSVAFSPDGLTLASGSRDDTIRLWDASSGKALQTLEGHWGEVYSVAFT